MKVLITGSSSGIGLEIARLFVERGFEVVGFDVKNSNLSAENYTHYIVDVRSDHLPDIGDVDILINNAGVQTQTMEDISVNLTGAMNVTERYAFSSKIKSVLFIASASASTGSEFKEYVASKGGLVAYAKNVALRLGKTSRATVNSLSPGGVITPLNRHILDDPSLYKAVLDESLLGRWATSFEIAEWAYFLTVVNKSMTGQDLLIDNGEAIKSNFIW